MGLTQGFSTLNARRPREESCVHLSERNGVRSLHLGNSMVQSAMRLTVPNQLELAYTRCMMGFMLFHPHPENILMIGLGGGSLAKFVYHRLSRTKTTVVEINPQVIAAARNYFSVPPDDERLQVVIGEGGEYIAGHPASADVLMVDGFDDGCQVASLCTQDFYNHAHAVLKRSGLLVVNLLSRDKSCQNYLSRIKTSFSGHVSTLAADPPGNLIAFAFRQNPGKRVWAALPERAKKLENEFALPFTEFARKLERPK
ncbi:polyamine aminopropyltransferase [Nitrosovibrio tenuis]|uniref:Spermidine synthase n=1 Tax=Nitrosovibrio tenuis TaxID=1233 RepID=A0A1H7P2A7_9PROT|nr:polyamine aminopropyltransferase [Nitrosovibrio tenuis]SEL29448.1 spermidine synthase [Nitrosovibrio tenuis]